jgi:hypothetical protein
MQCPRIQAQRDLLLAGPAEGVVVVPHELDGPVRVCVCTRTRMCDTDSMAVGRSGGMMRTINPTHPPYTFGRSRRV